MTDNIKELANLQVVLLGVTETNVLLQTESGKGVKTLTSADLSGGGGGGSTVATVDNIVMQDTDGTLFFKRVSSDTPPVLTNWKLSDGSAYTITGTPVPYGVTSVEVTGTVSATTGGLTNTELRASPIDIASTDIIDLLTSMINILNILSDQVTADTVTQSVNPVIGSTTTVGDTSALSEIVSSSTKRIVLTSTVDCWFSVGSSPTAVTTAPSMFLPANTPSYPIAVTAFTSRVAVISTGVSGILSIIESA